jgi:hypothetical protein
MTNLNIKIKINELEELKPAIEYIKKLELNNSPELNPEITIELGEFNYFSIDNHERLIKREIFTNIDSGDVNITGNIIY